MWKVTGFIYKSCFQSINRELTLCRNLSSNKGQLNLEETLQRHYVPMYIVNKEIAKLSVLPHYPVEVSISLVNARSLIVTFDLSSTYDTS